MKISIIALIDRDITYQKELTEYIRKNSSAKEILELIFVKSYNKENAEPFESRKNATLFVSHLLSQSQKFDIGAIEAKGEILYFLAPGYFPPANFSQRIIEAVGNQHGSCVLKPIWTRWMCRIFGVVFPERKLIDNLLIDNLMIFRKLFFQIGGFRHAGKNLPLGQFLKNESLHTSQKII